MWDLRTMGVCWRLFSPHINSCMAGKSSLFCFPFFPFKHNNKSTGNCWVFPWSPEDSCLNHRARCLLITVCLFLQRKLLISSLGETLLFFLSFFPFGEMRTLGIQEKVVSAAHANTFQTDHPCGGSLARE